MKTLIAILLTMALLMATTKCKTNEDNTDGNESFAIIVDVGDGFAGAEGGAIPIVSLIVLDYRNESSRTEKATIKVDWPNGTNSSGEIYLPSTDSTILHGVEVDCDIRCPQAFIFKDEMRITVKVRLEFQGYISPVFEKVIIMKNYSG